MEAVQVVGGVGFVTVVSIELGGTGGTYETGGKLDPGTSGTGTLGGTLG